jgi:hypothetical protein
LTRQRLSHIASLEGRRVSVALADGSRIDDCQLVSTGRNRVRTLWIHANGVDTFLPHDNVVDLWEAVTSRSPGP